MKPRKTSTLAATLHGFFTDYLLRQRALSLHTLHSYRDSLKLLLQFVAGKKGDPSQITFEDLTVERVTMFPTVYRNGTSQSQQHSQRTSERHPQLLPLCGCSMPRTLSPSPADFKRSFQAKRHPRDPLSDLR